VPLNADALTATRALVGICRSRGGGLADHYLGPRRNDDHTYDPTRPGKWPRGAWREMCAAAGIRLRPYDLRHHGLTKLAEKHPEQVVLKIGGHVSPQMLRRIYAHVRLPALRSAVDSISSVNRSRPPKLSKTADDTRSEETLFRVAKLAEHMGIPNDKASRASARIRTSTSFWESRDKVIDETILSKEQVFRSHLRAIGMKSTGKRTLVLRVFLKTIKPISVLDLHYLAKAEDLKVSYHCVHRTLKLIVASGLATEIRAGDTTQYQHELAQCTHEHLACKDCGATITPKGGRHDHVENMRKQ
jgi:Fe2+ or Zn2+ uptake regulation protein